MWKGIAACVCVSLLAACAARPTQVNVVPTGIVRVSHPLDLELKTVNVIIADQASQSGKVMMSATFPPLWRDAIQVSVDQAGLFKDDASRKVTITATIKQFEYNPTGFSNTVNVEATYVMTDRSNGQTLFDRTISTTASSSVSKEYMARARLINLWNETTQDNIAKFIAALSEYAAARVGSASSGTGSPSSSR
jgi:hypothetical protein